ncbi:Protein of unknown function [Malonomonas rubra DSM 5091]|uniref:DUF2917 domain-containing protein n=1 Tax=Malonomonas rubra DSM 5091 TaxID=1122189 RepID=A0A1M6IJZ6_MALRU|nr:DUF2917 domain-containing protein [Malonomonas rubra]SHJ34786.1 Protein of unknown function [Malonomonas rubra DSM 5091]
MEILLAKNELLDLGHELKGLSIFCHSGRCWVTQSGDGRDHILHSGRSFKASNGRRLIVTATEDCRLMLLGEELEFKYEPLWQRLRCGH